jgi:tetratricopeptide (TPR) repeat protein
VLTVYLKEIKDALRDRRTTLMVFVTSIVMGPMTLVLLAQFILGLVLEQTGDFEAARVQFEKISAENRTPAHLAIFARLCIVTGHADEGRKILAELTDRARQHFIPAYSRAVIHLALGEKEEALTLLENSFDERGIFQGSYGSIKTDKRMDGLRSEPRFQKLVAQFLAGKPE